jgi:Na+/melibiose symporter-like transporter
VPDFADLLRHQIGFVVMILLPSALLGLFPVWLALRRGRHRLMSIAALATCVGAAFMVLNVAEISARPLVSTILLATLAALLTAMAWSFVMLRPET